MRPTWLTVACAAALGCAAGAAATLAMHASGPTGAAASDKESPSETGALAQADPTRGPEPPPRIRTGEPAQDLSPPTAEERAAVEAAKRTAEVESWVADLARARETKDRKLFDQALSRLTRDTTEAAAVGLRDLVVDLEFEFPEGGYAPKFDRVRAWEGRVLPGLAAAARARFERESRRFGRDWTVDAWLTVAARHSGPADVERVLAELDRSPSHAEPLLASLGHAPPALAREALLRESRRTPRRPGLEGAIEVLSERSPPDGFAVLDEVVRSGAMLGDTADCLHRWARAAPKEALPSVRAHVHAMAAAGEPVSHLISPVQTLAKRGESVAEFAHVIASIGRELRRLVDTEKKADGTGPYYAIEYHEVAQTPENLAALQYAIDTLGEDRTRGCRQVLDRIRERSSWK